MLSNLSHCSAGCIIAMRFTVVHSHCTILLNYDAQHCMQPNALFCTTLHCVPLHCAALHRIACNLMHCFLLKRARTPPSLLLL